MTDPYLLLMLCVSCGITMGIAGLRQHWVEFGVLLFGTVFSAAGLLINLV